MSIFVVQFLLNFQKHLADFQRRSFGDQNVPQKHTIEPQNDKPYVMDDASFPSLS